MMIDTKTLACKICRHPMQADSSLCKLGHQCSRCPPGERLPQQLGYTSDYEDPPRSAEGLEQKRRRQQIYDLAAQAWASSFARQDTAMMGRDVQKSIAQNAIIGATAFVEKWDECIETGVV